MMRASQQAPQPQPLPPPPLSLPSPPAAPRRGRHRSSYSSSSSSSSSVSSASTFCPSPSPAASPLARATSLVPFSWERHPGVPKSSSCGGLASPTGTPLPLPPPLRQAPRRRRRRHRATNVPAASSAAGRADAKEGDDPFVAAFAECTRDDDYAAEDDDADDKLWPVPTTKPTASGRAERRWWIAGGGLVALLDLYGCKSAMDVANGTFHPRRLVAANARPPVRATRR